MSACECELLMEANPRDTELFLAEILMAAKTGKWPPGRKNARRLTAQQVPLRVLSAHYVFSTPKW